MSFEKEKTELNVSKEQPKTIVKVLTDKRQERKKKRKEGKRKKRLKKLEQRKKEVEGKILPILTDVL
jgi:hypothetical protein